VSLWPDGLRAADWLAGEREKRRERRERRREQKWLETITNGSSAHPMLRARALRAAALAP